MTTAKSVLMIAVLAVSSVTIASAKSWSISVSNMAQAGNVSLPAGDYSLKIDGTTATFRSKDTDKVYSAPVKVENGAKKYSETAVLTTKKGDTEVITGIELGGTTEELEFGE
jgi:hypothetical protein